MSWPHKLQNVVLLAVLCVFVMTPALHGREFRAADTRLENYPTVKALLYLERLVAERTGGRHNIRVFHSHQLGEEKEAIEQTRVGAIDLDRTNVASLGSLVPAANVLALPFLFRSADHLHAVLDGPIGDEILASFQPSGFIGLTFYDSAARSLYNSVRPVRSLADMNGLNIRVQQSELMMDMIKTLGAAPIELPYGQVKIGLATKLIDGVENNWSSFVTTGVTTGHYKFARYYTLTEHTMSPEVLVMSLKAWESLPPDDRRIFRDAVRESSRYIREQWFGLEKRSRREAEAAGVEVVSKFDRPAIENAMTSVYAKAAQDPAIASLIQRIRQVQ